MLPFKSKGLERAQPDLLPTSPRVEAELALWEQLAFSFEMDNDQHRSNGDERAHNPRRSRSGSQSQPGRSIHPDAQDAALLAQFAAAAGMPSHGMPQTHPFGSLISPEGYAQTRFQDSFFNNHGHDVGQALPPLSSMDFPWSQFPTPQSNQDPYAMMQRTISNPGMSPFPTGYGNQQPRSHSVTGHNVTGPPPSAASTSRPTASRRSSIHNPPVASSSTGPSSPDPENMTEAERIASAEEKRRRNTAASARFRIKKKQRTTNLERSVSDLTGRAEDLEREAADLRRENGWLKEIVMLKGSRLAAVNLASHIAQSSTQGAGEPSSSSHPPRDRDSESEEPSSGHEEEKGRAGKNKKKTKKK